MMSPSPSTYSPGITVGLLRSAAGSRTRSDRVRPRRSNSCQGSPGRRGRRRVRAGWARGVEWTRSRQVPAGVARPDGAQPAGDAPGATRPPIASIVHELSRLADRVMGNDELGAVGEGP